MSLTQIQTMSDTERLTIVVSFRERWSLSLRTLESIVRHTKQPYRLIFLDIGMSPKLRAQIEKLMAEHGRPIEIVDAPKKWPTQARAQIAPDIDTDYAIFLDNDVLVSPGWEEALIKCADEVKAGIVGPLYLWGRDEDSDVIHMAGGVMRITEEDGKKILQERHRLINTPLGEVEDTLVRETCAFAEFHCLLMRRDVLQAPDIFHPNIVSVHEHIHASLTAKEMGYETWLEPDSRILYLAHSPWSIQEAPLVGRRWATAAAERSLSAFAERWNVIPDERSFAGVRRFLINHTESISPIRVMPHSNELSKSVMSRAELRSSPGELLVLAGQRQYSQIELRSLIMVCLTASRFCEGIYRPCGRPFANHLMGTASVLLHYGFVPRLVAAALLHASLTHVRPGRELERPVEETIKSVAGAGALTAIENYTTREERYAALLETPGKIADLSADDVDVLLLETANLIEMCLSLESAVTGRTDTPDAKLLGLMKMACRRAGLPGMATALEMCIEEKYSGPTLKLHSGVGSFVFSGDDPVPLIR